MICNRWPQVAAGVQSPKIFGRLRKSFPLTRILGLGAERIGIFVGVCCSNPTLRQRGATCAEFKLESTSMHPPANTEKLARS